MDEVLSQIENFAMFVCLLISCYKPVILREMCLCSSYIRCTHCVTVQDVTASTEMCTGKQLYICTVQYVVKLYTVHWHCTDVQTRNIKPVAVIQVVIMVIKMVFAI